MRGRLSVKLADMADMPFKCPRGGGNLEEIPWWVLLSTSAWEEFELARKVGLFKTVLHFPAILPAIGYGMMKMTVKDTITGARVTFKQGKGPGKYILLLRQYRCKHCGCAVVVCPWGCPIIGIDRPVLRNDWLECPGCETRLVAGVGIF